VRAVPLALVWLATSAAAIPLEPPAKYVHPYPGPLEIVRVDHWNVWKECSADGYFPTPQDVAGCAQVHQGECLIFIAMKTKRAPIDAILRHELAHCNGWKH
jgi:penicillin-binding protein-related factor A (putative recombinase)